MANRSGNIAVIILAAGMGKRMKSKKAKVLHAISGKPMILYVVETARRIAENNVILVVGNQAEGVKEKVSAAIDVEYAYQDKQLGTGHAVSCAIPFLNDNIDHVLVLCGDVPLIQRVTLLTLVENHMAQDRDITILAVKTETPRGYGRILYDDNLDVSGIVEEADADASQKAIKTVNTGIYCIEKVFLKAALKKIRPDNAQGEFYLTDIIKVGYQEKKRIGVVIRNNFEEFIGINTREDLIRIEKALRKG